ncbi:Ctr copper transporter family-domain-containing protein [Coprinopsis sp. MPI-PUGE-AT-0042]|nr:Ctr copper transporter family-domain-containing protein [Coprinopsis sp. MPI-PUGE-AT-0042]KAH6906361.1 Ctr copper transporter family-domain-containing protein [Coprinopsis sp. MPI-PUGE-AT-0042]
MNHGDHGGHDMPGHDMPVVRCSMHMLWNTEIENTCIVFKSWHISSRTAFVASCVVIIALCVFHEWLRVFQKKLDFQIAQRLHKKAVGTGGISIGESSTRRDDASVEEDGLLTGRLLRNAVTGAVVPQSSRIMRASVYGATVFISFFLMLVFMTYNAYLIASVVFGAALGHYVFGATMNTEAILHDLGDDKGMACH